MNPKATGLLRELEALKLISIRKTGDDGFMKTVRKLSAKAKNNPPSSEAITKKAGLVRTKRYAKAKR